MRQIWSITQKELHHYFTSVNAYVITVAFLLLSGWFFVGSLFIQGVVTMQGFFQSAPLLFIIFIPAMTMRLFAEERKQGTLELLLTMPLSDVTIVLGKFFAATIMVAVLLLLTLIYPITLSLLGTLDMGPVIGGYLGLLFTGMGIASIGVFVSSLTESQAVSYIGTLFIAFLFFLFSQVVPLAPTFMQDALYMLGFGSHFQNISKGILDSRDLLYYGSFCVVFLFATLQILETRKK